MISIFYTQFLNQLPDNRFEYYLETLPEIQKNKNKRFIRWQEKHLHLFGQLLLIKGLNHFNLESNMLNELGYNACGRPYLKNRCIDFNISHSGNCALCVVSDSSRVGIDIEKEKDVEVTDFKRVFTNEEWRDIENSATPLIDFYSYWTRKESVIKADGRGLSIPLDRIDVRNNHVECDNYTWYLKELTLFTGYHACLASNSFGKEVKLVEVNFF